MVQVLSLALARNQIEPQLLTLYCHLKTETKMHSKCYVLAYKDFL